MFIGHHTGCGDLLYLSCSYFAIKTAIECYLLVSICSCQAFLLYLQTVHTCSLHVLLSLCQCYCFKVLCNRNLFGINVAFYVIHGETTLHIFACVCACVRACDHGLLNAC